MLSVEKFLIHDFDARGVPDGADLAWRRAEIRYWLGEASKAASQGIATIICGFVDPEDFEEIDKPSDLQVQFIMLHARPEIIRARLTKLYSPEGFFDNNQKVSGIRVDNFISGNIAYAPVMLRKFELTGCLIIDTSDSNSCEVARGVLLGLQIQ